MRKPPSESLLSAQMYPGHRIMKVLNRTSVAVKIRTRKKKTRDDDSSCVRLKRQCCSTATPGKER
jgi:hypothetical protein